MQRERGRVGDPAERADQQRQQRPGEDEHEHRVEHELASRASGADTVPAPSAVSRPERGCRMATGVAAAPGSARWCAVIGPPAWRRRGCLHDRVSSDGGHEQDHRAGRGDAELAAFQAELVDQGHQHLGGAVRAAVGEQEDLGEDAQAADCREGEQDGEDRPQRRAGSRARAGAGRPAPSTADAS